MVNNSQPKRRRKRSKKSKQNDYFTHDTELAILEFQSESDVKKQQKIFVEKIRPAFLKLVENIIFVYKFHTLGNIDVLKNDCLSFLFETLNKFDGSRGHKAFSYFNVVAKNWYIQRSKVHKKKARSDVQLDDVVMTELENNKHQAVVTSYEDKLIKEEFIHLLKDEIRSWRTKFDKPQERMVLEAVIVLFENPDIVPLYNKKGIYMYLREITGMNTKQVVTNLTKLRKKYQLLKGRYLAGEI